MIPAKALTKYDTKSGAGVSTSRSREGTGCCHDNYSVPVKSAANVISEASSRVRPGILCEAAEVDLSQLNDPRGRIPLRQLVTLYETAARLTSQQTFGLRVGAKTAFRAFDLFGYIIINSATLEEALKNAVRYFPLWTNGAAFRMERDGLAVRFIWEYADPNIAECRHDCEMTLLTASKICRLLRVHDLRPREVHFQHSAPNDTADHRRLFGTSVFFRMPANQLIFDTAALACLVTNADRDLYDVLIRYAKGMLVGPSPRLSLTDRVRAALGRSLLSGDVRLTTLARSMGMSSRTLQRKVNEQGSSFRGLVGKLRRELAEQYLKDSEMGISEIAYRLGYAQPSEFHRAFRRWKGTTPTRYRRVDPSDRAM